MSMRDNDYEKKIKREAVEKSKEEYTKKSGVDREFSPLVRVLSHPALWSLVAKVSELFYHTDLGGRVYSDGVCKILGKGQKECVTFW